MVLLVERKHAVQVYSASERAETLTTFRNELENRVLRDALRYDSALEDGICVERMVAVIASLDVWEGPVLHCLMGKERRGGHHPEWYADTYGKMVVSATKQFFEN